MAREDILKSALESMMFIWGEPLEAKLAADVFGLDKKEVTELFRELMAEYESQARGIRIREVNNAFQFHTFSENDEYIRRLCTPVKERRLTQSAMEVLAIIAYKQPVTKGEIEAIRGIKCDRVIEGLLKKDLIEEAGRSTGIGRPILYGTTTTFLENFGFSNLKDMPRLEDISDVIREQEDEGDVNPLQVTFHL